MPTSEECVVSTIVPPRSTEPLKGLWRSLYVEKLTKLGRVQKVHVLQALLLLVAGKCIAVHRHAPRSMHEYITLHICACDALSSAQQET